MCVQFGPSSDVCKMAEEQGGKFSPERCAAMLGRYEQTVASAVRYVEGLKALTARDQLTTHGLAPSLGSFDAKVTIVVFSDFDSPECGRGSAVATSIKNLYADQVRLVFRHFPQPGQSAASPHLAAQASLAAHAQGKFWAYHDILFGNPQAHDRPALERYAKEVGLDMARFRKALESKEFAADVDADIDLGRKVNVKGVPTMFVNGKPVPFPYGVDELSRVIDGATGDKP